MKKRTQLILLAMLVLVVVISFTDLGFIRAFLRPDALRHLVQEALESQLQTKIVIKDFEIDILHRPRVTLEKITLGAGSGFIMQADGVVARFKPWYLLIGQLEIRDITLTNPRFTVDLDKLAGQGAFPEFPPIKTAQGSARLIYQSHTIEITNISGSLSTRRISLTGDTLGGSMSLAATKAGKTWHGDLTAKGMHLAALDARFAGVATIAANFRQAPAGYDITLNVGAKNLVLPGPRPIGKASLSMRVTGNKDWLKVDNAALICPLVQLGGSLNATGIRDWRQAQLDLALQSNWFDYDRMAALLPLEEMPPWLIILLRQQIRGGHAQIDRLRYRGTFDEMSSSWITCVKNLEIRMGFDGQSYSQDANPRITTIKGQFITADGTVTLKGLTGMMNTSRINRVDIKFPEITSRGFRVSVAVDAEMAAPDFVQTWRTCIVPEETRALLDPIHSAQAGTVKGRVSFFYQDITDTAVIKGTADLNDVSLTWDDTRLRHLTGRAVSPDYDDPVVIQSTALMDEVITIESLAVNLREPFKRQLFSYALRSRGYDSTEGFGMDPQTQIQATGTGAWPDLSGTFVFTTPECSILKHRLRSRRGAITGTGDLKATMGQDIDLFLSNVAINLGPGTLRGTIATRGEWADVRLAGGVDLATLQAPPKEGLVPAGGTLAGNLRIVSDANTPTRMTGSVDARQACFLYQGKPLTLTGPLTMTGDRITSSTLKIKQDQMTALLNGALTLEDKPLLTGELSLDGLSIGASQKDALELFDKFRAKVRLKLTNLSYNGIRIQGGTAQAELGPSGLRLVNLDLADTLGTVKGSALITPAGGMTYYLDLALKDAPIAQFIAAAWPGSSPWMEGLMDLTGKVWGDGKVMHGDVALKARTGRINRYNLVSRIFSVLNPYKMIKSGEVDLLHKGFPYNHITATFTIRDSVVYFNDFYLDSNSLQISAVGRYLIRTHYIDTVLAIQPLETFDKTIHQIPIVGWVLTGDKGALIVITLRARGPVDDTSVTSQTADGLSKSMANSLLRVLKLPVDLITKPKDVILPGALKDRPAPKP